MGAAAPTKPMLRPRVIPWRMLGDDALARLAAGGSDGAFTALYERYHGPLLAYARSILLDAEDARDATQSALEKALRALPGRDDDRPLRPWLYRIVHNESVSLLRRRRPQVALDETVDAPCAPAPELDAERRRRLAELVEDLRALPERQRGALVMRELSGLGYDEIAGVLGISAGAARQTVSEARSALHDFVAGRDADCVAVRDSLDGDRRSLRARRVRAHLRTCDACDSFQRSIADRRGDLHLLGPFLSGTLAVGVLGVAAGVAGGGVAGVGAGITAAVGGAVGGVAVPVAAKGLAVVALIASAGTAATVELRRGERPAERPAARAQAAVAAEPLAITPAPSDLPPGAVIARPEPSARGGEGSSARPRGERGKSGARLLEERVAPGELAGGLLPQRVGKPVEKLLTETVPLPEADVPAVTRPVHKALEPARRELDQTEQLVRRELDETEALVRRQMDQADDQVRTAVQDAQQLTQGALDSARTQLESALSGFTR